ncbi:hypothetical protein R0J90_16285, partial [Micrococcus sp. SIMBA_144]
GEGVKLLREWFDVAIIKDDYYFYLHGKPSDMNIFPPYLNLGDMKVLVGGGHILEGMASDSFSKKEIDTQGSIVKRKNYPHLKEGFDSRNA